MTPFYAIGAHLRINDRPSTNGVPGRASYPIIRRPFIGRWRFIEREKFTARRAFSRYIGARGLKARVVKQSQGDDGTGEGEKDNYPDSRPEDGSSSSNSDGGKLLGRREERRRDFNSFHEWTKAGPEIGPSN